MDRAKGILVKMEVGYTLWASKKTIAYFDENLSQKALTFAKKAKIGIVSEINDKYIQIYFVEDEDNQQSLYLSPKSKTEFVGPDITPVILSQEDINNSTDKNNVNEDKKPNQWFSNVLAVIGEGLNAYTSLNQSSYNDYVNSNTDYPNYSYPKSKISNNNSKQINNAAPQASNNTFVYLIGFVSLLILLIVIFKISNKSKVDVPLVRNSPSPSVIYIH